jgi:hypothetical protein
VLRFLTQFATSLSRDLLVNSRVVDLLVPIYASAQISVS